MKQRELYNKQKKLFKLYFNNNVSKEDSIDIKDIITVQKEYYSKWQRFYFILRKYSNEFRQISQIDKIQLLNYNNISYLIIKIYSWTYLCIDLTNEKIVNFGENIYPFNEEFFIENFDEDKSDNVEELYYSIEFKQNGIKELINFIVENKNLFLNSSCFTYKIEDNNSFMTFLNFSLLKGIITLYFGNKYMDIDDDATYIYIDNNLNQIEVSNKKVYVNKLKKMCSKLKNIKIPIDVIPNFVLDSIRYNKLLEKNKMMKLTQLESI